MKLFLVAAVVFRSWVTEILNTHLFNKQEHSTCSVPGTVLSTGTFNSPNNSGRNTIFIPTLLRKLRQRAFKEFDRSYTAS